MKRRFSSVRACLPVTLMLLAGSVYAQSSAVVVKSSGPFAYDSAKEITLNGTVSEVFAKPTSGMIMGSHLLLQTSSGTVDASLGRFAFEGKNALAVTAGQQVAVTGVMKTINNQQVLLARTVSVDGQVHVIRTAHGVALSPQARQRAVQSAWKGDLQ